MYKFFWRIIYLVFQSARIPELLNCRDSFCFQSKGRLEYILSVFHPAKRTDGG